MTCVSEWPSLEVDVPEAGLGDRASVRLGLRPMECALVPGTVDSHDGTILVIEPFGNATDITLRIGDRAFIVRAPGFSAGTGERCRTFIAVVRARRVQPLEP